MGKLGAHVACRPAHVRVGVPTFSILAFKKGHSRVRILFFKIAGYSIRHQVESYQAGRYTCGYDDCVTMVPLICSEKAARHASTFVLTVGTEKQVEAQDREAASPCEVVRTAGNADG